MIRNDLNYARGLAILMIVIGHTSGIHPLSDKLIYSLHVPLFFCDKRHSAAPQSHG